MKANIHALETCISFAHRSFAFPHATESVSPLMNNHVAIRNFHRIFLFRRGCVLCLLSIFMFECDNFFSLFIPFFVSFAFLFFLFGLVLAFIFFASRRFFTISLPAKALSYVKYYYCHLFFRNKFSLSFSYTIFGVFTRFFRLLLLLCQPVASIFSSCAMRALVSK